MKTLLPALLFLGAVAAYTPPVQAVAKPVHPLKTVVAGGGPAGAFAAILLSPQHPDWEIDIYERSTSIREIAESTLRVRALVLNKRGRTALGKGGVSAALDCGGVTISGTVYHTEDGWRKSTIGLFGADHTGDVCVERRALSAALLEFAARNSANVKIYYGATFADLDVGKRTARFAAGDNVAEASYDLLIGAGGANSRVREALEQHAPGFKVNQKVTPTISKTFRLPRASELPGWTDEWENSVHLWKERNTILLPGPDKSLVGGIALPAEGEESFSALMKTPKDVLNYFLENMPMLAEALGPYGPDEAFCEAFLEVKPVQTRTLVCNHLAVGRVALVGDAAHSMSGSWGQGVNAAFETCTVLADCLQGVKTTDVELALKEFDRRHLSDAHAVSRLSDATWSQEPTPMEKAFAIICKIAPWKLPPPPLANLNDPKVPYSKILRQQQ